MKTFMGRSQFYANIHERAYDTQLGPVSNTKRPSTEQQESLLMRESIFYHGSISSGGKLGNDEEIIDDNLTFGRRFFF